MSELVSRTGEPWLWILFERLGYRFGWIMKERFDWWLECGKSDLFGREEENVQCFDYWRTDFFGSRLSNTVEELSISQRMLSRLLYRMTLEPETSCSSSLS